MSTDLTLAAAELPPPSEPVRKDKRWRHPHPRPGALTKRGPSRPYRRVPVELLDTRVAKMTKRIERLKKQVGPCRRSTVFRETDACPPQHETVRRLLTKYSHEKTYRLREAISCHSDPLEQAKAEPLQEFPPISDEPLQEFPLISDEPLQEETQLPPV